MSPNNQPRIGLLAIRVSSDKQGLDGDSPEAQHEQGKAYAKADNIIIIETIILLESASHETQPMQKVIDACKDKSKGFQVVACPKCGKILSGSASRGKMGAYYPAYHCSRNGHYFRVPKPEFDQVLQYAKYILEHLPELLLDLCNPLRKAAFFAAVFNKIPTYDEIKFGTHKNSPLPEVNELFRIRMDNESFDGDLTGNRTPIARMKTWCPDR